MAGVFAYTCSCCGKRHEGSPSFGFDAPYQYASLSAEQKLTMGKLSSDLCTITHEGEVDRFIRTILEIPIVGAQDPFVWGVWVSLSERSYERYVSTYDNPVAGERFFGWLCNTLPVYPRGGPFAADALVQLNRQRPKLVLHNTEPLHPLVADQRDGISIIRAQEIAEAVMHRGPNVA
jgi:hypothetical protein